MNNKIFEVQDKTGRKIRLPKDRWNHIRIEHPEIIEPEEIEQALINPIKILTSDRDPNVGWYYLYKKQRKRYLKVSVKYLNGEGYVITAHYTTKID